MMNPLPNFDVKNPHEYPTFDNAPVPLGNVTTVQRIAKSFNAKVLFRATLAILTTLAFFETPLLIPSSTNLTVTRLLFIAGLGLGVCESILWQNRNEASVAQRWRRIVLGIVTLAALILAFYFLRNNSYILSLCWGAVAGSAVWSAVVAFRSNWATYS